MFYVIISESEMLERAIVFAIFFCFEIFCLLLLGMVKSFINSKPPGRRLVRGKWPFLFLLNNEHDLQVTSDIHVILANALQILFTCFSVGGFLRTLYGPLPFWLISVIVEMMKWALSFTIGTSNVNSFMQKALLMDFR